MGLGGVGPPHPALLRHGVVPGAAYTLGGSPGIQLQTQHSHPWALSYTGGANHPGGVRSPNHLRPPRPPHYSVSRTRLAARAGASGGVYHELPPLISASESHSTSAPNFHTLLAGQDSLEVCAGVLLMLLKQLVVVTITYHYSPTGLLSSLWLVDWLVGWCFFSDWLTTFWLFVCLSIKGFYYCLSPPLLLLVLPPVLFGVEGTTCRSILQNHVNI